MKYFKTIHYILLLLFIMIPLDFSTSVQCKEISTYESIPKDEIFTFQGHRYWFCNDTIIWSEAKERCEQLGGHLVTISSEEENDFIAFLVKKHNSSYTSIGLTDEETEGTWKWITGETSTYRNWDSGEPNNGLGIRPDTQNWAYKLLSGYWDDGWMSSVATYVCEWETITLSTKANPQENCIDLQWEAPEKEGKYSYTLKQRHLGEETSVFQSIPATDTVKVLQIYPAIPQLLGWTKTYGQGKISCDAIRIEEFNKNPDIIWNYDVAVIGFWNGNNWKDFTQEGYDSVTSFIESGKSVLFGHDTVCSNKTGFYSFGKYLNLVGTNCKYSVVSNKVTIKRKGFLTNYPYQIGDVGTTLTIPTSHDHLAPNKGTIWLTFAGTDCPYLSTWNNCAFIQTGHSNGAATADEQRLVINTIYYLAQRTSKTSWQDHMGQDVTGPQMPTIEQFQIDYKNREVKCNFSSEDLGDEYEYYVEAINDTTSDKTFSNYSKATITVGLHGYSYIIDNQSDTIPDNKVDCTIDNFSSIINSKTKLCETTYLHVKAIDYAGNVSETLHFSFGDLTPPTKPLAVPDNHKIYWLDSEDTESEISHYEYRVDNVSWNVLNSDSTFDDDAKIIEVRAVNYASGVSESCIIEIETEDTVEPDDLILNAEVNQNGYCLLTWNSVADVDGISYYIYQKDENNNKFILIDTTTACEYEDETIQDTLVSKRTYYIVAKCDLFDDDVYSNKIQL